MIMIRIACVDIKLSRHRGHVNSDTIAESYARLELDFRTETNIVASHMSRRGW